jgi:hypothetical protein
MELTQRAIVADIRNIASSGSNPIEFRISDEQIALWVDEVRAMLIEQYLDKREEISDTWYQTITCLQLEQVDAAEGCCAESDCHVLRTVKKVPLALDANRNSAFVTTPLGDIIPRINRFKAKYQKYSAFTKSQRGWYWKDDRIYVINDQVLTHINYTDIFISPVGLSDYVGCDSEECYTQDSPYPVGGTLAKRIVDVVLADRVYKFLAIAQDNKNDANDSTLMTGKPQQ